MADVQRRVLRVDGTEITLLAVCQGLEGEAEATRTAIEEAAPRTVALPVDPGMASHVHELAPDPELGGEDAAYERGLSRWGEVKLPPPEYQVALEVAQQLGAEVAGVDIPQEEYLDRFTETVGVIDLTKRALQVRWLKTRPPRASDPITFCERFDAKVNKGPFAELERARERRIAERLRELAKEGPVVCLLEIARAEGVAAALGAQDPALRKP